MNILNKILGSLTNYEIVRSAVAKNPNTPDYILEKLSDDKNGSVREAILNNPNTPPELKTFMMLKY